MNPDKSALLNMTKKQNLASQSSSRIFITEHLDGAWSRVPE